MEGYFSKNQSLKIDLSFKSQLIFPKFLGLKEKSSQKVWIGVFGFPLKNGFCSPKSTFESHITFVHFHCPKEDPKKRSQNDNSKLILSVAPRKKIYSSGPFSKAVFLPFSWSDIFLNRKVVYRKGSEKVVLWKVCEITKPRLFQRVYSKTGSALTGWLRWPKVTWKNTNPSEGMSNSQNQGFSRSLFRSRVCPLRVGFADRNWPEKHSPLKGYFFSKFLIQKMNTFHKNGFTIFQKSLVLSIRLIFIFGSFDLSLKLTSTTLQTMSYAFKIYLCKKDHTSIHFPLKRDSSKRALQSAIPILKRQVTPLQKGYFLRPFSA